MKDKSDMYTGFNPSEKPKKKTVTEWIAGAAYNLGKFWRKIKAVENEVDGVSETEDQQSFVDAFRKNSDALTRITETLQEEMKARQDLRVKLAITLQALSVISGERILSAEDAKNLLERHTVEGMRACAKAPPGPPGTPAGVQGHIGVKVGKDFNREALECSAEGVVKNPRWRDVAKPKAQSQEGEIHE